MSDVVERLAAESDPRSLAAVVVAKMRDDAAEITTLREALAAEKAARAIAIETGAQLLARADVRAFALEAKVEELRDLLAKEQASEAYQRGKAEAAQRVIERLRARAALQPKEPT